VVEEKPQGERRTRKPAKEHEGVEKEQKERKPRVKKERTSK